MLTVTLEELRDNDACCRGYNMLVCALRGIESDGYNYSYMSYEHDKPIPLTYILESNGLADAIWSLCCFSDGDDKEIRLFDIKMARLLQHLMHDKRSTDLLDVSERYVNGESNSVEIADAEQRAWTAYRDSVVCTDTCPDIEYISSLVQNSNAYSDQSFDVYNAVCKIDKDCEIKIKELFIELCDTVL